MVTDLNLVVTPLNPHTKICSFCDNRYFSYPWKDTEDNGFLSMEFKRLYNQHTEGEVNMNFSDEDGPDLNNHLKTSTYIHFPLCHYQQTSLLWVWIHEGGVVQMKENEKGNS